MKFLHNFFIFSDIYILSRCCRSRDAPVGCSRVSPQICAQRQRHLRLCACVWGVYTFPSLHKYNALYLCRRSAKVYVLHMCSTRAFVASPGALWVLFLTGSGCVYSVWFAWVFVFSFICVCLYIY